MASAGSTLSSCLLAEGLNELPRASRSAVGHRRGCSKRTTTSPSRSSTSRARSYNCLKREGIHTVGELTAASEADLMDIRNFGQKSITEVKEKLAEAGLRAQGRCGRLRPRPGGVYFSGGED